jgi:Ca-activated chloride channel family protein
MNGFEMVHFIRPWWLLALPLAILLPWWWQRMRKPAGDWEKVCDPHLLRWLSVSQGGNAGNSHGGGILAGLAIAITALALSGPSWQALPESTLAAHDARVIALDLSSSMLAEDLRPNRLARARFRIADLLTQAEEGQTGLVAYAGDAYVVSPLTNDTNTIASLLPALGPEVMPVTGSRGDKALELSAALLQRAGFERGEILLVTDASDSRAEAKARELRDKGMVVSVLGVGTSEGAPIPSGSGFVSDRSGNVVIARLDEAGLQRVANAGGGRLTLMTSAPADTTPWMSVEGGEFSRREESLDQRWKDAGPFVLLLLLPLAMLGFRRGLLFCLPLVHLGLLLGSVLVSPSAQAGWWDDLWQRRDQQAWDALQEGDSNRAAALAKAPDLSGEAWYRSGGFSNALSAWMKGDSADAHYNRGNALAQMGELDAAIQAYDRALELDPAMEDAQFNRDLLQQEKDRQQQEQEQQDGEQGESKQESDSESQEGEQGEEGQQGQEDQGEEQGQEGEQQSQQGEGEQQDQQETDYSQAWTEEDAQAMEQWLRRIPDDPGGLLRRKFLYEHQRRGEPASESDTW